MLLYVTLQVLKQPAYGDFKMSQASNLYHIAEEELPEELIILYNLIKTDLDRNFSEIATRLSNLEKWSKKIDSDMIYLRGRIDDLNERISN